MEREEAIKKLKTLEGKDLRSLANRFEVTVWKGKKINKGWAGHVLERFLGLPINSSRSPNFGSWELKLIPLHRLKNGSLSVKETMAITMIDSYNVKETPFENSHLFAKMKKMVVCARIFESKEEKHSILYKVQAFDMGDQELFRQIKSDYEETRQAIINNGFQSLTGAMGVLIQPRTKGSGNGSKTRAFYARTQFVKQILQLP